MEQQLDNQSIYTPEEKAFIQKALLSGFKEKDIRASIQRQRVKNTFLGKVATQKWLSPTLATVGGGIGLLGAGPAGAGTGAFGGYGLGEMLKTEAKEATGLSPMTRGERLGELGGSVKNALTAGAAGLSLGSILAMLPTVSKYITNPLQVTGKNLEAKRAGTQVNPTELEDEVLGNLSTNRVYKMAPIESQRDLRDTISRYLTRSNEWQTSGGGASTRIGAPKSVDLNDLYQNLISMKNTTDPTTYRVANEVIRQSLNPRQSQSAQNLSKVYSALEKAAPYAQKAKYGGAGAIAAGLVFKSGILDKIADMFGIGKD
jgi:hypothetical protein